MQALFAVIDDLYHFALGAIFSVYKQYGSRKTLGPTMSVREDAVVEREERRTSVAQSGNEVVQRKPLVLKKGLLREKEDVVSVLQTPLYDARVVSPVGEQEAAPQEDVILKEQKNEEEKVAEEVVEEKITFRSLDTILTEKHIEPFVLGAHGTHYVCTDTSSMYARPTKEFDGVVMKLHYGNSVTVEGYTGKFARATVDGRVMYMLRDDLTDAAAEVFPQFVVGEVYDVDTPSTIRLRAIIADEFCGGALELPLQAGEYVLYRLVRRGIRISWPLERPRTLGRWHALLRGVLGVHSGVISKTGTIMEYTLEHDMGHLAYVEAVFPNETILISEANYPDNGIYNERTLTREEWRELKPIFIQIT